MRKLWKLGAVATALTLGSIACGGGDDSSASSSGLNCPVGKTMACMCPDGQTKSIMCPTTGRPPACPCFANPDMNTVNTVEKGMAGSGGAAVGSGGAPIMSVPTGAAGMPPMAPMMAGSGGVPPVMAGTGGAPPVMTGTGGVPAMMTGTGGAGPASSDPDIEMARQICVDTINMYRATVTTEMLAPLMRGTPADETCSDKGAKQDGDSGVAHGSAGMCMGYAGGQDACPGWGVGGFSGNATLADAIKSCLAQMWAEGMPPVSRMACQMDYQNCFLKYGHYLNMSDPGYTGVVCGFYKMSNGSWWMNQDFKSKPWGAP